MGEGAERGMQSNDGRSRSFKWVVLLLLLVLGGWIYKRSRPKAPFRGKFARTIGAPELPASTPPERIKGAISFFALGDTGEGNQTQRDVAAAMSSLAERARPGFLMFLGDNVYPDGVDSVDDEDWRTSVIEPYDLPGLRIDRYAVLGNHDYNANPYAEVEFSRRDPLWVMPAPNYRFTKELDDGDSVEFFALDTNVLREGGRLLRSSNLARDAELTWIREALEHSTATWKIVFGHHPLISNGTKGGSSVLVDELGDLFERTGVALYISGHDHDLQLLDSGHGWHQLVSGAGAKVRTTWWKEDTLFAEARPGFCWVQIAPDKIVLHFVTAEGGSRFTAILPGEGRSH
ncbi:MAG TPA: hypothetical protein ENJ09_12430 [Planctomycetes bacterium]|nr:hypothetical protein [Planctomycetota bacterium]